MSRRPVDEATFEDPAVAAVFDTIPEDVRKAMLEVRAHIFDVAAATEGVGRIEEALRWGEPAYLTSETKSGSTIRLGWRPDAPDQYALHFICTTRLVERFRTWFPRSLEFEGNRSIVLRRGEPPPLEELGPCIEAALLYHRAKRRRGG